VLSTKLFDDVKAFVDQHYVETTPKDAGIDLLEDEDMRRLEYFSNQTEIGSAMEAPVGDIRYSIEPTKERRPDAKFKPGAISIPPTSKQELESIIGGRTPGAETFSEMLLRLIDKSGKKDSDVYNKAGQSKQTFSKIRTQRNYQPSKNTVLSFAIALELNMDQTLDLLKSAGFTLSNSIRMDVAIKFFIESGFYDLFQIKITLFGMDITF